MGKRKKRTPEQNRQQWPILAAFSSQKKWVVGGSELYLSPDDWKDILTAGYKKECIRMAKNLDGDGFVMLGSRTSEFYEDEWSEWMAFLNWAASEYGIQVPISKKQAEMYQDF